MAHGMLFLDDIGRWRSCKTLAWLRKHGIDSVPASIRSKMLARLSDKWMQAHFFDLLDSIACTVEDLPHFNKKRTTGIANVPWADSVVFADVVKNPMTGAVVQRYCPDADS